jgi:hypothetical protein
MFRWLYLIEDSGDGAGVDYADVTGLRYQNVSRSPL